MVGHFRYSWGVMFLVCVVLPAVIPDRGVGSETVSENNVIAAVAAGGDRIEWHPRAAFHKLILTVSGPGDYQYKREFQQGSLPFFQLPDNGGDGFPDGTCGYRLELVPASGGKMRRKDIPAGRDANTKPALKGAPEQVKVQSGSFLIAEGRIVSGEGVLEMESDVQEEPRPESRNPDQCINDDAVIVGSLCVGNDCVCPYPGFGFDTIVLAEDNLRILFDDASTIAGYPANDWRITLNDSTSGGAGYFSIDDATGGTSPFRVEAGAPDNSLYVEDYGRIGLGTSTPYVELHMLDGDSPTIRLEQDSSFGWTAQTWDIAGNESNFFIRDATNGSKLPFRIQPNTPSSTLCLRSTGTVGVGTWSPQAKLHVQGASGSTDPLFLVERLSAGVQQTYFTVKDGGDVELFKSIGEGSDRNLKKNIKPVDTAMVLAGVAKMPVSTWNYKVDHDAVVHMGPMAQDFHAAFGLGKDDKHITSIDASGVSLAAIQELNKQLQRQHEMIQKLQEKIARLEVLVKQ